MDPQKWKLVKEAFSAIETLPADARTRMLSRYPEEIRAEVFRLLDADPDAGGFIQQPAVVEIGLGSDDKAEDLSETMIGGYRLIRKLGHGGMGTVYLAEHLGDGFSQIVAVKLIKPEMDSAGVLKRFLAERRILANLDHPNIAKMFDGGSTPDNRPYFVMEYVRGESIREYSDRHRLGIRERVELFLKVCAAVAYAHQNLVVHRDLKPSNILVTEDGEPKLLDFGIAKVLRSDDGSPQTAATATQFRVMTPEYASPEQIRGELTSTSSDVYSLGVILYELAAGCRPFTGSQIAAAIAADISGSQEPLKPSTVLIRALHSDAQTAAIDDTGEANNPPQTRIAPQVFARHLKGDLDNIILKAIRFEPEHRYATVNDFADDLRAYLNGMPVTATADSFSYRMRKFFLRHKVSVVLTAVFMLMLLAAGSLAAWQAYRANEQRKLAEKRFSDVRNLAGSLIFDLHDAIRDLPGSTAARRKIAARAIEYLDGLAVDAGNDMGLLEELAQGYERLGDVRGNPFLANLGEPDGAIESYRKAIDAREKIAAATPDNPDSLYSLSLLHSKIRAVLQVKGDTAGAESELKTALALLANASRLAGGGLLYQLTESRLRLELGEILLSRDDRLPSAARDEILRAISIAESTAVDKSDDSPGPDGLTFSEKRLSVLQLAYRRLGQYYEENGMIPDAAESYRKAYLAAENLKNSATPAKPHAELVYAISLGNLARILAATDNPAEAQSKAEEAVATCQRLVAYDPANHLAETELAAAFEARGVVFSQTGQSKDGIADLETAVKMRRSLAKRQNAGNYEQMNLAEALLMLGKAYEIAGGNSPQRLAAAENAYRESLALWNEIENKGQLPRYYSNRPSLAAEGIRRVTRSTDY